MLGREKGLKSLPQNMDFSMTFKEYFTMVASKAGNLRRRYHENLEVASIKAFASSKVTGVDEHL